MTPDGKTFDPETVTDKQLVQYEQAIDRGLTEADAMRLAEHEYNGFQANAIIAAALNPAVGEDVLDALATPKYTAAQMTAIAKIAIRGGDFARFLDPQMDARRMEAAYLVVAHGGDGIDTDNFKEIGSLFGREGAGAGFAKQTDKESFTYAFAWPEGDTWATLTGYLNLDEQPEEYVRRVLQDGGFRSDWGNPDYDPIGDFKETAGDEYRIPLLKVLLREQLESRYEVANHFSTMNRARVELSAFIQSEGGAPLPEDALGTPEEQGIRAMLIATGEPPREVTLLPDKNGSTLKSLQALVGGNIETFDIAFGEEVSLYVNEEGLFTCPPNRAIFATEEMAKAGYLSQLDYSKVVEMGDFYTVLNGDIVAVGFDPETGESRSLTDGETARVEGYFTVISRPGSGAKAVDDIRHGITPGSYDISVESHDCTSGRNALAADAPAMDAPGKDDQNIG